MLDAGSHAVIPISAKLKSTNPNRRQ